MNITRLCVLAIALAGLTVLGISMPAAGRPSSPASLPRPMTVQFITFSQAGLPEQDVFVESDDPRDDSPTALILPLPTRNIRDEIPSNFIEPRDILHPNVVRIEPKNANLPSYQAKSLFASNRPVPHDPFRLGPQTLGPFPKGDALGLTLAQWQAARGSGIYTVDGDKAELALSFQRLVPLGSYSLWCGRETLPPSYTEVERPCGAANGSDNSFKADAQGNAAFHLRMNALRASTREARTILLLEYDRHVQMWDEGMGGYGWNNHVQLFFTLPASW